MGFESFWKDLTQSLVNKTPIKNWTKYSGYLRKGDFEAIWKRGDYIECYPPGAKNTQVVSKEDFKLVYDHWKDYLNGKIRRPELRDLSRFTKYTISIINQFKDLM